jgi:hypothetical protein
MPELPQDSPFAEFAEPKRSAVEEWREQQRQERSANWKPIRGVGCAIAGSAIGAAFGISLSIGFDQLPFALLGAVVGGVVGMAVGACIGCACYAFLLKTNQQPAFETQSAHASWSAIEIMIFAWSLIGVMFGAALGGTEGLAWGGGPQRDFAQFPGGLFPWAFIGSILGSLLSVVSWLIWEAKRKSRHDRAASTENDGR